METLAQDVLNACLTTQNLKLGFFLTEYDGKVNLYYNGVLVDILTSRAPVLAVRNRCTEVLEQYKQNELYKYLGNKVSN
jgi:hypothetical protein